jgi:hypothetical protein
MVRTLKITSILAVLATIAVVIFLAMAGFRSDPERDKLLNAPGAIEEFKKGATKPAEKHEEISPLIKQARLFALLINPPPPPKPKPKVKPKKPVVAKKQTPKVVKPPPKPKAKQVTAKFKLLGTCRNIQSPESSFALLDIGRKKQKWVQQGQVIEHLTIQEIKDGSIVTFKNGKFNNELAMLKTKSKIKSLLKDALSDSQPPIKAGTSVIEVSAPPVPEAPTDEPERIKPKPASSVKPSRKLQLRKPVPRRTGRRSPISSKPRQGQNTRTRKPLPEPTPLQRKKSLDDSIDGIKDIMKEPNNGVTEAQKAEERKAWDQLLNILEQERGEVEGEIKKKNDDSQGPKK